MISAIVIDDEQKLREVLKIKLEKFCPDVRILGQGVNAEDGFKKIIELKPDLIFLDVAMPGETGFDMLSRFVKIDFEIIFVTGFNEYALDALKVSAVDYILKPIITENLVTAVNKAKERIENRTRLAKYEVLKHNLNHLGDQNAKIAIPGGNSYEFVKMEDIIRCEGWQKYTKLYLANGKVLVSSYNLGKFRDMLEGYNFFSTHKSHLINKTHIVRYDKDGVVVLVDGSIVPIARRRKDDFIEQVVKYLTVFL